MLTTFCQSDGSAIMAQTGLDSISPVDRMRQYAGGGWGTDHFARQWVHIQAYVVESSPSADDGSMVLDLNGERVVSRVGNVRTRTSDLTTWSQVLVGYYVGRDGVPECAAYPADAFAYFDDLYVDSGSAARVEIGDSPNYASARHRETAIPSAWSDTSITVTARRGSFATLRGLYLYVVAPDGTPSQGFPLGSGPAPTTPPCYPTADQVAVYEHSNYQGACVVKATGTYGSASALVPLSDNTASSARVGANVQANLCQGAGLTGTCQTFRSDVPDLTGSALGNDTTSSVQVEGRTAPCYPNADQAALYEHTNFQGACAVKGTGIYGDSSALVPLADNITSSVRVGANVQANVCQGRGLTGTCQMFRSDVPDLTGSALGSDTASSVQVEGRTAPRRRRPPRRLA
jgi:hypothetical protein